MKLRKSLVKLASDAAESLHNELFRS